MKRVLFFLLIVLVSLSGRAQGKKEGWGNKITSFSCRTIDAAHSQEWNDLSRSLRKDGFEEWFGVRKGKERLQVLSREGREGITELACMIVGKEGDGLYMSLGGRFTVEEKEKIKLSFQKGDYDREISRHEDN
ncbi:MAG: hypothetical protein JST68_20785 [Bacteroidetes bacterium]|nr:hypothetical protein [Bacteroidota bacterium]